MGRKSLAVERRSQILDSFEECIVIYGLEGATMQRISAKAEVKLSMIPHYFGNREGLVSAMIDRFLETYRADFENFLESVAPTARLAALLDLYFSDIYSSYRPQDNVIMTELMGLAQRQPAVKQQLLEIFQLFEDLFCQELQRVYPDALKQSCQKVAHILISLWYGNATLIWLGFGSEYGEWTREMVEVILGGLGESS